MIDPRLYKYKHPVTDRFPFTSCIFYFMIGPIFGIGDAKVNKMLSKNSESSAMVHKDILLNSPMHPVEMTGLW